MKKKTIALIVTLLLLAGASELLMSLRAGSSAAATPKKYEMATVSRGKLETTVTSSGTLAPVSSVSVLSQMNGRVEKVYANYNDRVKKGQVLVSLNTDMLELQREEAKADLSIAQANYNLAELDYQNDTSLASKGLVSQYDLKSSKTTLEVKKASLASAQSALKVIETQLTQYALIKSPIDGIVLEKEVDVGQSVVEGSSSNATALFTLAEDLSKMEIKAEVDELDIGSIQAGQDVRFSVEANPGKEYSGSVEAIHLIPETTDNVVNYYVIIKADNADGSLLPGMTANVEFIKEIKESALLVPNSALRFQPSNLGAQEIQRMEYAAGLSGLSEEGKKAALAEYDAGVKAASSAKSAKTTQGSGLTGILSGGGPGMGGPGPSASKSAAGNAQDGAAASAPESSLLASASTGAEASTTVRKALWYFDEQGKLAVRMVGIGSSDGASTEIIGADDLEGTQVILREKAE